ncbi:MAG: hypothetical protein E5W38_29835, partial [Mesorhizobium sp.]
AGNYPTASQMLGYTVLDYAAAGYRYVLPGIAFLGQILLQHVESGRFTARRPPMQHLHFLDVRGMRRERKARRESRSDKQFAQHYTSSLVAFI